MNTNISKDTKFIYSEVAEKAIEIGRQKHWRFRVVGYGPVPDRPFFRGAWWFEPVKEAPQAKAKIDALKAAGIDFKGFVVAHEVVLVETKEEAPTTATAKDDFKNTNILPVMQDALRIAFSICAFVLQAALIDPALIVVLDDQTWLECETWYV